MASHGNLLGQPAIFFQLDPIIEASLIVMMLFMSSEELMETPVLMMYGKVQTVVLIGRK